jgi:pyruvate dehydrogenase E2 component (dihydrolipoamide acetyltransferase)
MSAFNFLLPDLGEGLTEATIVRWLVTEGQSVEVDTPLAEVETAKTTVELPSPYAGTVARLQVAENETVPVGSVLITLEVVDSDAASPQAESVSSAREVEPPAVVPDEEPPLLIGYGSSRKPSVGTRQTIKAKPPVRKLARDLGVDLAEIPGSGAHGEITREDIKRATVDEAPSPSVALTGIRKHMAHAMTRSATESPQATLFLSVDVTELISFRTALNRKLGSTHRHLSVFGLMSYLFTQVVASMPLANSSLDAQAGVIITHPRVNLGIAVAGPNGLVVPVVKAADTLSMTDFVTGLASLIEAARTDSLRTDQLLAGTVTVTNVGALGIDSGVPLLNPGESAILAIGAVQRRPWVITDPHEQLAIRSIVDLALTIDHRIMDGKDGADVLRATADLFHHPAQLLANRS